MKKYVEFIAEKNDISIKGFVDLDEIDDDMKM